MLLNFWRFDLNFATVFHFLEHFLSNDLIWVSAEGLHPGISIEDFKSQVLWFADVALAEVDFIFYKSSIVAAACIANARSMLGIVSIWNLSLELHSGYSHRDIADCAQLLRSFASETRMSTEIIIIQEPVVETILQLSETDTESYDKRKSDGKWKCKAPSSSFNCARTKRRHLFSRTDLKQMYCAR